eukprot:gene24735-10372_t
MDAAATPRTSFPGIVNKDSPSAATAVPPMSSFDAASKPRASCPGIANTDSYSAPVAVPPMLKRLSLNGQAPDFSHVTPSSSVSPANSSTDTPPRGRPPHPSLPRPPLSVS